MALPVLDAALQSGTADGMGTFVEREPAWTLEIGAGLHILIHVISTVLLVLSNYPVQLLYAPTRTEIDDAHGVGQWLEIGLLSFHNLTHQQAAGGTVVVTSCQLGTSASFVSIELTILSYPTLVSDV